jgi:hypothetical protein
MHALLESAIALLRQRWHDAHADDRGAAAIEWAIFAILALTVAALVAAAITAAVNNRLPLIQ